MKQFRSGHACDLCLFDSRFFSVLFFAARHRRFECLRTLNVCGRRRALRPGQRSALRTLYWIRGSISSSGLLRSSSGERRVLCRRFRWMRNKVKKRTNDDCVDGNTLYWCRAEKVQTAPAASVVRLAAVRVELLCDEKSVWVEPERCGREKK